MNVCLRPLQPEDAESFAVHANNPKIADNLTNQFPNPYSLKDAKNFIDQVNSRSKPNVLGIQVNSEICGAIGVHEQKDVYCMNMEMGYWLAEKYWGHGIMSQIIPQMVSYAFKNFNIKRIFARPYGDNLASQKVLEKSGFTLEAILEKTFYKNNKFKDELIYAVRKK